MGFEIIENIKKVYPKVPMPETGIRVTARKIRLRRGVGFAPFIRVKIGPKLARGIGLTSDLHKVRLAFGTGVDAGKIQVSVDNGTGGFIARRDGSGAYALTINKDTADGLLAVEFSEFTVDHIEAIRPDNGKPPYFVFKASAPMLAVVD